MATLAVREGAEPVNNDGENFACAFAGPPGCPHGDDLFRSHYERANRMNSTKILRCFPHCCPCHVNRSYCGSSLTIKVSFPPWGDDADRLHAFARFCETDDSEFSIGMRAPMARFQSSQQSDQNTRGEWIVGQLSQRIHDEWLLELNLSRRWYYAWQSGKTNKHRYSTHTLQAVVVVLERDGVAKVVAKTASPPFTIASFRRSGGQNRRKRRTPRVVLDGSLLERFVSSTLSGSIHVSGTKKASPTPSARFIDDLAVIFASLQYIPAQDCHRLTDREASPLSDPDGSGEPLVLIAKLVWWLTADRGVRDALTDHSIRASRHLLDVNALLSCYEAWLRSLQARVIRFLAQYSTPWCTLVAVAGAVSMQSERHRPHCFDWDNFVARARQIAVTESKRARKPEHSAISALATAGGREWICPLDSISIVRVKSSSQQHRSTTHRVGALPLAVVLSIYQQVRQIVVELDLDTCSVRVASAFSGLTSSNEGTKLILDGRHRCFNSYPNGEPTMSAGAILGGQCFGDYIGRVTPRGFINVSCFSWPVNRWTDQRAGPTDVAYRWNWTLRLDEARGELKVDVEVASVAVPPDLVSDFACRTAQDRVALFDTWRDLYKVRMAYEQALEKRYV